MRFTPKREAKTAVGFLPLIYAGMMELVDMRDLGSRAFRRWGSSPHARTTSEQALYRLLRLVL